MSAIPTPAAPSIAWRDRVLGWGSWSVLLCLFSVPLNKPATNIFIFFALLFSLIGSRTRERWLAAVRQPVVLGALAWYGWLLVTALYAPAGPDRWEALSSYKALFYPLVVASLFETRRWHLRAMMAFGISVSMVLLISWAQFGFALAAGNMAATMADAGSFTVFKNYTQQGIAFMVLAAMAASFAYAKVASPRVTNGLWLLAGAALVNVMFLLQSRTAYLIVVPVVLYWAWCLLRRYWSPRAFIITLVLTLVAAAAILYSPRLHQRLAQAQNDVTLYSTQSAPTSMGIRLELWRRTLPIIAAAPVLGHGFGQWKSLYYEAAKDTVTHPHFIAGHPHQEALLLISEQGFIGLAVFILLMVLLMKYVNRLEPEYRHFYRCLLLIYITAGLANCVLADFGHRHVFLMLLACIPLAKAGNKPIDDSTL